MVVALVISLSKFREQIVADEIHRLLFDSLEGRCMRYRSSMLLDNVNYPDYSFTY